MWLTNVRCTFNSFPTRSKNFIALVYVQKMNTACSLIGNWEAGGRGVARIAWNEVGLEYMKRIAYLLLFLVSYTNSVNFSFHIHIVWRRRRRLFWSITARMTLPTSSQRILSTWIVVLPFFPSSFLSPSPFVSRSLSSILLKKKFPKSSSNSRDQMESHLRSDDWTG